MPPNMFLAPGVLAPLEQQDLGAPSAPGRGPRSCRPGPAPTTIGVERAGVVRLAPERGGRRYAALAGGIAPLLDLLDQRRQDLFRSAT